MLYLSDPPGVSGDVRRRMLDGLAALNSERLAATGDPEINARIAEVREQLTLLRDYL